MKTVASQAQTRHKAAEENPLLHMWQLTETFIPQSALITVGMKIIKAAEWNVSINLMSMFYHVVLSIYRLNKIKDQPRAKFLSFFHLLPHAWSWCVQVKVKCLYPLSLMHQTTYWQVHWDYHLNGLTRIRHFWLLIEAGYKMNNEPLGSFGVPNGWLTLKTSSSRTK